MRHDAPGATISLDPIFTGPYSNSAMHTPIDRPNQIILVVDDHITNLKVAIGHLEAYSYEVLTARNGEAGLQRAAMAQPDLILLDVQMPDIDGFEVCKRLKANPTTATIPVIFMTVRSDTADKVMGLEAGAVDFVTKPVEAEELLARVRTHLQLRHLQERLEEEVAARTAALTAEIEERKRQQAEKERLFETVRAQSDQLRNLTHLFLEAQQKRQEGVTQLLNTQVKHELSLLCSNLEAAHHLIANAGIHRDLAEPLTEQIEQAKRVIEHLQQQAEQVHETLLDATTEQQRLLDSPLLELSTREREVLRLLVDGKSNAEIAELLTIARGTVSTYRRRIMDKLGVDDTPALIRFALQHNLVL